MIKMTIELDDSDSCGGIAFTSQLTVKDVRSLSEMTSGTGFFSEEEVSIVKELIWAAITDGEESGYLFIMALPKDGDRSRPLGFACYGPAPCTRDSWRLYWIVVDGKMQGQGHGKKIICEVERRVRARGGRKIFLETSSRQQYSSTWRFYESSGYSLETRFKDYYAQGEDCLVFAKELAR